MCHKCEKQTLFWATVFSAWCERSNNLFMRSKCPIKIGISVNLVITYSMVPTTSFIAWNPTWECLSGQLRVPYWCEDDWFSQLVSFYCFVMEIKFGFLLFVEDRFYLFWRTWECEVKHKHGKKVLGGKAGIKISNVLCCAGPYLLYISTICKIDKTKD